MQAKDLMTVPAITINAEATIEDAAKLLLETDLTLSSIGYKLGFSAPAAFTRSAIRWFDMTPSEYRQIHRK